MPGPQMTQMTQMLIVRHLIRDVRPATAGGVKPRDRQRNQESDSLLPPLFWFRCLSHG